uniref:alpha-L-rhamnosidase n=1 Tax=uncultured bacterium r_07 TaxID=1132281 RepID=I6YTF1_9BACT|nr:alpha-L-rhamnosidase GHF78 [uncultured bacterium r_07]
MKLNDLRVCNLTEPLGFTMEEPVFSWTVEEAAGRQLGASLEICAKGETVYDSGENPSADSLGWAVPLELLPRTRYDYTLRIGTADGQYAEASSSFETGKRDEPWTGSWISPAQDRNSALLRRRFFCEKREGAARLYLCGLGVYEAYLNGEKIGEEYLAPGYHAYDFHLAVQTYDVTALLREGENSLVIALGEGWFKGRLGFEGGYTNLYGDRLYAIAELWQGDTLLTATDENWEELRSPIRFANIYDGETWDARIQPEIVGPAELVAPEGCGPLQDRVGLPVVECDRFPVKELIRTPKGGTILDFGQNLTGWVRFSCALQEGASISLTAGEILQDGEFYHENYRTAVSRFTYISDGTAREVRPHFTFFGFRYMKVDCDHPVRPEDFTAVHLRSAVPQIVTLHTGSAPVNRLFQNALWGMKDNFLDVPSDCPQRDERLGWTGDAQAISATACQSLYMPAFYRKYLWDMRAEQSTLEGSVPNVVPRIKQGMIGEHGSSPWADAAVIIPWNVWSYYGSWELLRETYPGMKAWVDCQRRREEALGGEHLVKDGFHFADWLALDNPQPGPFGATDPLFIASAYYFRCAQIVAEAAEILSLPEADEYRMLAAEILRALREKYFDETSLCRIQTQTAAALALVFGLTEDPTAQGRRLRELVAENGDHLNTGFVGTPILCEALSMSGHHDAAVTLLLQEDYPSWLYSVKLGATTIWERWNSVLPDGHMNPEGMNSLNHYTYGSVAGWMISWLCGLRPDAPGYRRAVLEPRPDRRLGQARVELDTAAGRFVSAWRYDGNKLCYEFCVPFGAEAELRLPGREAKTLTPGSYHWEEEA